MTIKAVIFDAYGTLFDVYSVSALAEQLFAGKGDALSQAWRDKQIEYTRILTLCGKYDSFWNVTRNALRYSCKRLKLELTDVKEQQLMNAYSHLSAFPENLSVLQVLNDKHIPTAILSNGNSEMLQVAVKSAHFDGLIDHLLSVDAVGKFKTAPEAYALGPAAFKLKPQDILFVSSNGWDAAAATWYGYATLWINRISTPVEELGIVPTHIGKSLDDVLTVLNSMDEGK